MHNAQGAKRVVMDWLHYFFLPEAVNRELCGRGAINWVKRVALPRIRYGIAPGRAV